MKHGAVDYLQKPFSPRDIRELVSRIMDREALDAQKAQGYAGCIELAKKCVNQKLRRGGRTRPQGHVARSLAPGGV